MPYYKHIAILAACFFAFTQLVLAQQVGADTIRYTVLSGGSVTVPEGAVWQFVSLSYGQGAYSMRTTWEGPDTLTGPYTWVAPFWCIEAELLGDGKSEGMYFLEAIKLK